MEREQGYKITFIIFNKATRTYNEVGSIDCCNLDEALKIIEFARERVDLDDNNELEYQLNVLL